jgi:hypothetical protein
MKDKIPSAHELLLIFMKKKKLSVRIHLKFSFLFLGKVEDLMDG